MARNKVKWAEYMREYTAKNKDKINLQRRERRKENLNLAREKDRERYKRDPLRNKLVKYGISKGFYFELIELQNGLCAICGTEMNQVNIDHCHTTGKVRGLLCTACNTGIGKLKEDLTILQSAIDYLKK